jgi:hypothetical protein
VTEEMRQWVLTELPTGEWRLSSGHSGEIRALPVAQSLLATIFSDLTGEAPIVAVAHWLAGEVEGMHNELLVADVGESG